MWLRTLLRVFEIWGLMFWTAKQLGSVAHYVSCIWGMISHVYSTLKLSNTFVFPGAQRGRIGLHLWDINVLQVSSMDLLVVSSHNAVTLAWCLTRILTKPSYLMGILPPPTMLFLKTTFFILYLQLFNPMRWLRLSAYIGITFTVMFYAGMTIALFIFTTPRQDETWLSHQFTHSEQLALAMSIPHSCVGLAVDVYILVLPIIAVSKLQMPARRKVGIILLFATGLM